jgi:GTPase SAR1 family protein
MPKAYGQLVVGPPGSGKTTYCRGLEQLFDAIQRRHAVVNLDPANDNDLGYKATIDIRDLIECEKVQEEMGLGPNGALVFAMEYLEENVDWLVERLQRLIQEDTYLVFDMPGQVELFSMHPSLISIIERLHKTLDISLTSVMLVDSVVCTDAGNYMSSMIVSLNTMLHLGLPHVNVLSKVDMLERYGELEFHSSYYVHPTDLHALAEAIGERMLPKYRRMTAGLCEVLEDFGLVGQFAPVAVEDRESMVCTVKLVDQANGYAHAKQSKDSAGESLLDAVVGVGDTGVDVEDIWERMKPRLRERD